MDSAFLLSILFNIGITVEAMTGALAAGDRRMDIDWRVGGGDGNSLWRGGDQQDQRTK